MRPLIGRIGGKFNLKHLIIPKLPHHDIYIEPFLGSGAIFFNKKKARISILSDLDELVYETFCYLKSVNPNEEFEGCEPFKEQLEYFVNEKEHFTIMDRLYKNLIIHGATFSSKAMKNKSGKYVLYDRKKRGVNVEHKIKNRLKETQESLKDTLILNEDYKNIIKKFDGKDSLFFLDPPYENSKRIYKNEKFDFSEFRDILKNIKGKFFLTINSSDYLKDLFKDFYIEEVSVNSFGTYAIGKEIRKELFITNYVITS